MPSCSRTSFRNGWVDGEWVPHDLGSVCPCFVFPFYIPFLTALLYAPYPAGNPLLIISSLPYSIVGTVLFLSMVV